MLRRNDVRWIVLLGVLLHLAAALFSTGYFALDEHFQILEFAALKLGSNQPADLSWEYDSQIRPALQPAVAYVVASGLQVLGSGNPFTVATVLRLLSSALSLLCMYLLYVALRRELPTDRLRIWLIYLSLGLWFLPYLHARFSAEILGGTFFWIGLAVLYRTLTAADPDARSPGQDILVGLFLGLGFILRFRMRMTSSARS
jgi:phosphatidylinositol glycan class B